MDLTAIIPEAYEYVNELLEQLSPDMHFHSLKHTQDVYNAVTEIANESDLDETGLHVLQLAALFHDTGYLYHYIGHEDNSKIIAGNFLMQRKVNQDIIERVLACIDATKIPQKPQNIEEQIMCDADMYHFSKAEYLAVADDLKKEWEIYLGKFYTPIEWAKINLELLQKHQYFTTYGKHRLQALKEQNIGKLLLFVSDK